MGNNWQTTTQGLKRQIAFTCCSSGNNDLRKCLIWNAVKEFNGGESINLICSWSSHSQFKIKCWILPLPPARNLSVRRMHKAVWAGHVCLALHAYRDPAASSQRVSLNDFFGCIAARKPGRSPRWFKKPWLEPHLKWRRRHLPALPHALTQSQTLAATQVSESDSKFRTTPIALQNTLHSFGMLSQFEWVLQKSL